MTLSPDEIRQIAEAVATAYGPYAIGGMLIGLVSAVLFGIAIALKITVPFGARMVETKMLDPNGAVQKARSVELAAFKTEVAAIVEDKTKGLKPVNIEAMQADFTELRASIEGALSNENLYAVMSAVLKNREMAANARGDDTGGPVDPEEAARVKNALGNPEEAKKLAWAISRLDDLAENKIIKPATAKKYGKLAKAAFAADGTIDNVVERLLPAGLLGEFAGAASGVRVANKGGSFNPG